ncbi:MAG TPA: DUF167 domain-containing protein [Candidatus Enterousia avicola]|uniref:UPF0235 protein IAC63_00760 n=1 Tax=Candidatus Enterousia avicola TaxID=2840787 RepID=A0A9D1MRZ9_9PROT|nr:DUF167 domain-containing protein [Candidatus Enterousia avicola]
MSDSKQTFNVRVIPKARQNDVSLDADGTIRIHTTAAPSDGAANDAVIKMLAKHFDVPKSSIRIIRGATSRNKVIEF